MNIVLKVIRRVWNEFENMINGKEMACARVLWDSKTERVCNCVGTLLHSTQMITVANWHKNICFKRFCNSTS
jgi:hypothetical protein